MKTVSFETVCHVIMGVSAILFGLLLPLAISSFRKAKKLKNMVRYQESLRQPGGFHFLCYEAILGA